MAMGDVLIRFFNSIWICAIIVNSHSVSHSSSVESDFHKIHEANRHYESMADATRCHHPRPVVVDVNQVYPNAGVKYLPSCTIIYRCDSKSGCCKNGQSCQPKTSEYVGLYFYATPVDKSNGANEVIRLTFKNHTSCACDDHFSENEVFFQKPHFRFSQTTTTSTLPPFDDDDFDDSDCSIQQCPYPFALRVVNKHCFCDCFHGDRDCLKIKGGTEAIGKEFQSCIRRKECEPPKCFSGSFNVETGKCPYKCIDSSRHKPKKGMCSLRKTRRHRQFENS